jgi:hypothetical protein
MIGHQEVIAHEPRGGVGRPDGTQRFHHIVVRQPRYAVLGADGQPYDSRLMRDQMHPLRGGQSPDVKPRSVLPGHDVEDAQACRRSQM